ncbi:MAG: hypothetical protein K0S37_2839 [Microbacterium sp.]|jgi:hypothetical protein|nr:hypothetical protein [Microbacterium sp.]
MWEQSLIDRIESAVDRYGRGRPVPAIELRPRLAEIGIAPDPHFEEFAARWGGCFLGVAVHVWDNAPLLGQETCIELTRQAREDYSDLVDGLVFSLDMAGNPIWIGADGRVRLVDHDLGNEVVDLAPSFRALLAENVDG